MYVYTYRLFSRLGGGVHQEIFPNVLWKEYIIGVSRASSNGSVWLYPCQWPSCVRCVFTSCSGTLYVSAYYYCMHLQRNTVACLRHIMQKNPHTVDGSRTRDLCVIQLRSKPQDHHARLLKEGTWSIYF